MKTQKTSRRSFVGTLATSAFGAMVVPRHVLGGVGYTAPSDTLNIAGIGIGGVGRRNLENVSTQNIVALCDIDHTGTGRRNAVKIFEQYPGAERRQDYRRMFDERNDIDAVIVATPDHTHAVITAAAMDLGKHVYTQKPLTYSIAEARVLARKAAERPGLVTQMGNQGHSSDDARRVNEWIRSGAIGDVREVYVWTNRPIWPQGMERPAETPPVPGELAWDLFLGPAPYVPYHPAYHPRDWRGWVDWGTGALGDMGAHLIDHPFWALELGYPTSVETVSAPFNGDSYPHATTTWYDFPARGDRPAVRLTWYDGNLRPPRPEELPEGEELEPTGGVLYVGEKGKLLHDTYGLNARLLPKSLAEAVGEPPRMFDRVPGGHEGHEMNWVEACKGEGQAVSPFSYAAPLTETMLLGLVALRVGRKIYWDSENMRVTNVPEANRFVHREYRDGWSLT